MTGSRRTPQPDRSPRVDVVYSAADTALVRRGPTPCTVSTTRARARTSATGDRFGPWQHVQQRSGSSEPTAGSRVRSRKRSAANAVAQIAAGEPLFDRVLGYEQTVLPADRERHPLRARPDLPRRARPGEDAHDPHAPGLLDEWMPDRRRQRDQRRPDRAGLRATPAHLVAEHGDDTKIEWVHRDDRYHEKLATPDVTIADLIGEVDPIKVAEGPLPVRRADDALRPDPAHEPRHLRDQRAARPRRAHPGRPVQRAGRARRPDPRLPDPPARSTCCSWRQRKPGGLHQPRPDRHAAEGPLRQR